MASDEMLLRRFSCLDLCRIGISYKTNIQTRADKGTVLLSVVET